MSDVSRWLAWMRGTVGNPDPAPLSERWRVIPDPDHPGQFLARGESGALLMDERGELLRFDGYAESAHALTQARRDP
jgi:hypothetical protein